MAISNIFNNINIIIVVMLTTDDDDVVAEDDDGDDDDGLWCKSINFFTLHWYGEKNTYIYIHGKQRLTKCFYSQKSSTNL